MKNQHRWNYFLKMDHRGHSDGNLIKHPLVLILIVLSFGAIIIILALGVLLHQRSLQKEVKEGEICLTPPCIIAATDLLQSLDMSLNPCDDFYEYTCRTWMNDLTLVENSKNKFSELAKKLTLKLKGILDKRYDEDKTPKHFKKTKILYQACLDLDTRAKESLAPLIRDIKKFGGFPALLGDKWKAEEFDYLSVLGEMLKSGFDNNILFGVGTTPDHKNNSRLLLAISQVKAGMENLNWYADDKILDYYSNYTSRIAKLLCEAMDNCIVPQSSIDREIREAVMLETEIAQTLKHSFFEQDTPYIYHIMKIKDLIQFAPQVQWERMVRLYVTETLVTNETEVLLTDPEHLQSMADMLFQESRTTRGRRTLANYMMYRQVEESGLQLSAAMKKAFYEFEGQITGRTRNPDPWEDCVDFVMTATELSLASQYVKDCFPPARKVALEDLVEKLKEELGDLISATEWMDDLTKKEALKKVHNIFLLAAYPDGLLDDEKVNQWYELFNVSNSHYENYVTSKRFEIISHFTDYGQTTLDRTSWKYIPSSILNDKPYYNGPNNSIIVPLGATQDWLIEERAPLYMLYGRLGVLIGHELLHAIDTQGAATDGAGNWRNWWQPVTEEQFAKTAVCMFEMFKTYLSGEGNISLERDLTIAENVADDAAIIGTYAAFKKAISENAPERLPGIPLTVEQLFWVSYGSAWCSKYQGVAATMILTDYPAFSKFRVNSPLSNSLDFLHDFNCKPGDKMYREQPHCHVWGKDSGKYSGKS